MEGTLGAAQGMFVMQQEHKPAQIHPSPQQQQQHSQQQQHQHQHQQQQQQHHHQFHHQQPPIAPNGQILLANGLQPLSCLRCAHRKVKCDRVDPCSNCVKHSVTCEYRDGAPYKRKKKPGADSSTGGNDLQARLEKYESALKHLGVDPGTINNNSASGNDEDGSVSKKRSSVVPKAEKSPDVLPEHHPSSPTKNAFTYDTYSDGETTPGRLIVHHGKSRYVEGNLWTRMGDEFDGASALLPDSSDDEDEDEKYNTPGSDFRSDDLVLGSTTKVSSLATLHPSPAHFAKLWQAFIDNVHPITMVVHAPTTRWLLLEAIRSNKTASKDVEAVLFSVMATAVLSLSDDDCARNFGKSKSALLARFRIGARQALSNARFMLSSSFTVLQAFTLYLVSAASRPINHDLFSLANACGEIAVRSEVDARVLWNLTGIAVRNSHRLGLDKDLSARSGLKPFEVEMRRRLWYQIIMLDMVSSQQAGIGSASNYRPLEFVPPANVNDTDLHPDMPEAPQDRVGSTDMVFCRLRHMIFSFMAKVNFDKSPMEDGRWHKQADIHEKDKLIDDLEKELELEILRYCDFLQPIHFLTTNVARLILCKMRFSAHHPRRFQQHGQEVPNSERNFLFRTALKVLEYDNVAHAQPMVKRFMWHSTQHFQWSCLVHVLSELKIRTYGEEVDKAWEHISMAYAHRGELALNKKTKSPLYVAVNKMMLDAWKCREVESKKRGDEPPLEVPDCIASLREQQTSTQNTPAMISGKSPPAASTPYQAEPFQPQNLYQNQAQLQRPQHLMEAPSDAAMRFPDMYNPSVMATDAVDWSLFDSLINGEMMQGFGDATLSGAAFPSSF